ncbi:hypothetical protein QUF90_04000 [Desulfococcaceae bacterium HSG9]|nr:hypothetical protein [Desulfococcaceae bacterium HSG9]
MLKITDAEIAELVKNADLTDNFHAQARGNRIALKFQIPAVFAITYELARCAEITFTILGITPACHRCAVSSRYEAYRNGYKNDVTSQGSSVMQTHYLNACLGLISLEILHRNKAGCEFGKWFDDKERGLRNLVQLRMSPFYGNGNKTIFDRSFQGSDRVFAFDSVWQKIEPECFPKYTPCPDCGGTGNLVTAGKNIDSTMPDIAL